MGSTYQDQEDSDSAESEQTLEELMPGRNAEPEHTTYIARKALKELLQICDKLDISKQGLIREIEEGLDREYLANEDQEHSDTLIELDLIAKTGEKRLHIESSRSELGEDIQNYPRKIAEKELEEERELR